MSQRDPQTCRRALREIGEIAAVAVLPDSQMTDQEALQNIAAIAEWVMEEAPGARPDCGDVIRRLHRMTEGGGRRSPERPPGGGVVQRGAGGAGGV